MYLKSLMLSAALALSAGLAQAADIEIDSSNSFEAAGLQWLDLKLTRGTVAAEIDRAIAGTNGVLGYRIIPWDVFSYQRDTLSLKGWRYASSAEWGAMVQEMTGIEPNSGLEYNYNLRAGTELEDQLYDLSPLIKRIGDTGFASRRSVAQVDGHGYAAGALAGPGPYLGYRYYARIAEDGFMADSILSQSSERDINFFDIAAGAFLVRELEPELISDTNPQACGRPDIDSATEKGLYLWSDCDGSGRWSMRVTGGNSGQVVHAGAVTDVSDVAEFSIEGRDKVALSNERLSYNMIVYRDGVDGLQFTSGGASCLTPQRNAPPLFVGKNKVAVRDRSYRLATGKSCKPVPSYACGAPKIDGASAGTYIWSDCDGRNKWHIRAVGGDSNSHRVIGGIFSGKVRNIKLVSLEANDITTDLGGFRYRMIVWRNGVDGADFNIDGEVCFRREAAALPVYFGAAKQQQRQASVDLRSGLTCPDARAKYRDIDADGLTDLDESALGTNPHKADTDGDGIGDREEFANGSNPLQRDDP